MYMVLRNLNSTLRKYIYHHETFTLYFHQRSGKIVEIVCATMFKRASYYDKPTILIFLIKIYCYILSQLHSINIQRVKTTYLQLWFQSIKNQSKKGKEN